MPTESVKRPVVETESGSRYFLEVENGVKRVRKEEKSTTLIGAIATAIGRLLRSR